MPKQQWRSQAVKSGWAQGVWGWKSFIPNPGPGGAPVGSGAKPPKARYIQTICSCQMLFYAGLLPSPSSISPYHLLSPKKLRICANPMNQHSRGSAHQWLRYCQIILEHAASGNFKIHRHNGGYFA